MIKDIGEVPLEKCSRIADRADAGTLQHLDSLRHKELLLPQYFLQVSVCFQQAGVTALGE